jgi:hypothetical protein
VCSIGGMEMKGGNSVEHWWNGTDRGKQCGALVEWY